MFETHGFDMDPIQGGWMGKEKILHAVRWILNSDDDGHQGSIRQKGDLSVTWSPFPQTMKMNPTDSREICSRCLNEVKKK